MLFSAYEFIFLFLPITLFVFFWLGQRTHYTAAISWLVLCSFFFYAWWKPIYLLLLLGSIGLNYGLGKLISHHRQQENHTLQKSWLVIGVILNLASIGYFKYANFFIDNYNHVTGQHVELAPILLPLAISFFTFQQIAYLVDTYRGETEEHRFLHYCLFVTFFPQLIAGPIVHHREMLPQFAQPSTYHLNLNHITIGLMIFSLGLFKKVIIADGIAVYADPVFANANSGEIITFFEAWAGALAYTFQLYFDFSGYSDMAIGLARMFGIRLPINFNSPYKANSIVDFWRRWHITLSRFLRDYLYIALGGNRYGLIRRYSNLLITMLLGGLWHGAGWTFIAWGALHGFYLIINHAWSNVRLRLGWIRNPLAWIWASRLMTFTAVVVAWVFFRAENYASAEAILSGMFGLHGFVLPDHWQYLSSSLSDVLRQTGVTFGDAGSLHYIREVMYLALCFLIIWLLPNTLQVIERHEQLNTLQRLMHWRPAPIVAVSMALLAAFATFGRYESTQFLYFNF